MANKLLIVDDDLYIRELYEEILKNEGFEVSTAVDGKDGLDKILAKEFDLVLLDIMMPKMDGIALLNKLHESNKIGTNKIVLLTNLAHDPVIKEGIPDLGKAVYR